jgi:hypothetical protein
VAKLYSGSAFLGIRFILQDDLILEKLKRATFSARDKHCMLLENTYLKSLNIATIQHMPICAAKARRAIGCALENSEYF